jgi:hypothetical protein
MRWCAVPWAGRRRALVPMAAQHAAAGPESACASGPCAPVPSATGWRHASAHAVRHAADFSSERGEWRVVRSGQCAHDHIDRRDRGAGPACISAGASRRTGGHAGMRGSMRGSMRGRICDRICGRICASTSARVCWGPQRGEETGTHELPQAALEAVAVNRCVSVLGNDEPHTSVRQRRGHCAHVQILDANAQSGPSHRDEFRRPGEPVSSRESVRRRNTYWAGGRSAACGLSSAAGSVLPVPTGSPSECGIHVS